jgi:outer membrane biosynthesis protein TonB
MEAVNATKYFGGKMNSILNSIAKLSLAAALLAALAGCAAQPTATPTVIPSPTIAPTEMPKPTQPPEPTVAPTDQSNQPANGTQPAEVPTQAAALTPPATGTQPAAPVSSTQDKAQYVSQNIADGVQVLPGRTITITWAVKNVGTVAWTTDYTLRYFAGPPVTGSQSIAFPKTIAPDATANLTVSIVAPATEGSYTSWWKLANAQGQNFSDVSLTFTVTNHPGSVPTATPAS